MRRKPKVTTTTNWKLFVQTIHAMIFLVYYIAFKYSIEQIQLMKIIRSKRSTDHPYTKICSYLQYFQTPLTLHHGNVFVHFPLY